MNKRQIKAQIAALEGAITSVRTFTQQLADVYAATATESMRQTIYALHDQGDEMQAELDDLRRELLFGDVPAETRELVAANID